MGSVVVSVLDYFRSKTQVDWDSLDLTGYDDCGPWQDATSNQYETFTVMSMPENTELLHSSIATATRLQSEYPEVTLEELALDVCAANLAVRIAPKLKGNVHLMANPRHTFNIQKVVAHGRRYHQLCAMLDPTFDHMSRLVMKIAATWEGLQAARHLRQEGIKSLATTVFTQEQIVLAGEVGCVSISPFIHELKAVFDPTYREDGEPIFNLVAAAQNYYEERRIPTRIKACANMGVSDIIRVSGVNAFTAMPSDLALMAATKYEPQDFPAEVFATSRKTSGFIPLDLSYVDNEAKYRIDFAAADGGSAQYKLMQAMAIFCDYQDRGLVMIRDACLAASQQHINKV